MKCTEECDLNSNELLKRVYHVIKQLAKQLQLRSILITHANDLLSFSRKDDHVTLNHYFSLVANATLDAADRDFIFVDKTIPEQVLTKVESIQRAITILDFFLQGYLTKTSDFDMYSVEVDRIRKAVKKGIPLRMTENESFWGNLLTPKLHTVAATTFRLKDSNIYSNEWNLHVIQYTKDEPTINFLLNEVYEKSFFSYTQKCNQILDDENPITIKQLAQIFGTSLASQNTELSVEAITTELKLIGSSKNQILQDNQCDVLNRYNELCDCHPIKPSEMWQMTVDAPITVGCFEKKYAIVECVDDLSMLESFLTDHLLTSSRFIDLNANNIATNGEMSKIASSLFLIKGELLHNNKDLQQQIKDRIVQEPLNNSSLTREEDYLHEPKKCKYALDLLELVMFHATKSLPKSNISLQKYFKDFFLVKDDELQQSLLEHTLFSQIPMKQLVALYELVEDSITDFVLFSLPASLPEKYYIPLPSLNIVNKACYELVRRLKISNTRGSVKSVIMNAGRIRLELALKRFIYREFKETVIPQAFLGLLEIK